MSKPSGPASASCSADHLTRGPIVVSPVRRRNGEADADNSEDTDDLEEIEEEIEDYAIESKKKQHTIEISKNKLKADAKKVKKEKWRWRRRRRSRWRRSGKGGSDGGAGGREGLARGDVHERDGVERIEELICSVGTRKVVTE